MKNLFTFDEFLNEGQFRPLFKTMNVFDPLSKGGREIFDFFTDVYFDYLSDLAKRDGKTNLSRISLDSEYGDLLRMNLERETGDRIRKYDEFGKALIKAEYVKISKKQEDRLAELGYKLKK